MPEFTFNLFKVEPNAVRLNLFHVPTFDTHLVKDLRDAGIPSGGMKDEFDGLAPGTYSVPSKEDFGMFRSLLERHSIHATPKEVSIGSSAYIIKFMLTDALVNAI